MPEKSTGGQEKKGSFVGEAVEKKASAKETLALFSNLYRHYQLLQSSTRNLEESFPPATSPDGAVLFPRETEELEKRKGELLVSGKEAVLKLRGALEAVLGSPLGKKAWEEVTGRPPKDLAEAEEQVNKLVSNLAKQYRQMMSAVKRKTKDETAAKAEAARLTLGLGESPDPANAKKTEAWKEQKMVAEQALKAFMAIPGNEYSNKKINSACASLLSGSEDAAQAAVCLETLDSFSAAPPKKRLLEIDNNYLEADLRLLSVDIDEANWLIKKAGELVGKEIETTPSPDFVYNKEKAAELGLEQLELPAYPEADKLIARVIHKNLENGGPNPDYINISIKAGQEQFCRLWKEKNGNLPPPCTPPETLFKQLYPEKVFPESIDKTSGDFWYLDQLSNGKVVKNLEGNAQPLTPQFGQREVILVEKWAEEDWDATTGNVKKLQSTEYNSKLLSALGISARGVVNIKRETVDQALWQGDPASRQPTPKHQEAVRNLGLDPAQFQIRCIAQDEYARGASVKQWGNKNLWTNFAGYFLVGDGARYGLLGGSRRLGGASDVVDGSRGYSDEYWAVRLVLSRKQV